MHRGKWTDKCAVSIHSHEKRVLCLGDCKSGFMLDGTPFVKSQIREMINMKMRVVKLIRHSVGMATK